MNKLVLLVLIYLFIWSIESNAQEYYYGVDSFGKLVLNGNQTFSLDFFDNNESSGHYEQHSDTIILNSNTTPVRFYQNEANSGFVPKGFEIGLKVFDEFNCLKLDTTAIFDTLENRVYIELDLKVGDMVAFNFLASTFRKVIDQPIFGQYFVILDFTNDRMVYFENFHVLKRDKYLIPFSQRDMEFFRKINGFDFITFQKGNQNQYYQTYLSGYGIIR